MKIQSCAGRGGWSAVGLGGTKKASGRVAFGRDPNERKEPGLRGWRKSIPGPGVTATLESSGQGRSDGSQAQTGIGNQVTEGFVVQERGLGFVS